MVDGNHTFFRNLSPFSFLFFSFLFFLSCCLFSGGIPTGLSQDAIHCNKTEASAPLGLNGAFRATQLVFRERGKPSWKKRAVLRIEILLLGCSPCRRGELALGGCSVWGVNVVPKFGCPGGVQMPSLSLLFFSSLLSGQD